MQTYELTAGRSIDDVLRDLGEVGSRDSDIVLVVPAGNELLSQVENLSRLRRFVLAQGLNLRAVVGDRVTLGLFRIMGFEVDEARSGFGAPSPSLEAIPTFTDSADAAPPGETVIIAPAGERLFDSPGVDAPAESPIAGDWIAASPAPELTYEEVAGPGPAPEAPAYAYPAPTVAETVSLPAVTQPGMKVKMKVKTQHGEAASEDPPVLDTRRSEGRHAAVAPAPAAFAPPPAPPQPSVRQWEAPAERPAPRGTAPIDISAGAGPAWSAEPLSSPAMPGKVKMKIKTNRGETTYGEAGTAAAQSAPPSEAYLAATLPPVAEPPQPSEPATAAAGWDAQSSMAASSEPAAAEARHAPASGLDVTLPGWLHGEAAPAPPGDATSVLDVALPSWMDESAPAAASPAAQPAQDDISAPAWLHESGSGSRPGAGAPPAAPSIPSWLRQDDTPPAPQPAVPTPWPATTSLTPDTLTEQEEAQPAPVLTADAVREAAIAQAGGASPEGRALPPMDIAALAGPAQTSEGLAAAVKEAGLDSRTRALLLFGMALVRLAAPEAQAAAASARRLGCDDDELRLVVQMAQAIGGGPSERLGRRIVG